jgi:hypothetical protein
LLLALAKILQDLRWPGLRPALLVSPSRGSLPGALSDNLLALPFKILA